ncbi:MAG: hypothetical protein WC750_05900 [Patescibacteria group bacterium]|jgi:hypothetical protein
MNLSTIPQTPTKQDLMEITEFMCESGVVLKPVRLVLLAEIAKDPILANDILERVYKYIRRWSIKRYDEWKQWHQMTAHAWFALQTEIRLLGLADEIKAAKQAALSAAA